MTTGEAAGTKTACIGRLVLGPALITLAMTLLRFVLEGVAAPDWLASKKAGGNFAVIGIFWLPLVFGPWFVSRLRTPGMATWPLLKRLTKVLVVYGWAARIPVVAITLLALAFGWDTHFNKFGPDGEGLSTGAKVGLTLGSQLVFWAMIWTPITGGLAGFMYHAIKRRNEARGSVAAEPYRGVA